MRRPQSSRPNHVASDTSWSRAPRPKATVAGDPPTCSSGGSEPRSTASMRDSPTTRTGVEEGSVTRSPVPGGVDEVEVPVRVELVELVLRLDGADRPAARPHHEGVGGRAPGAVANSPQELAVGDAARDEVALTADQVLGSEDGIEVEAGVERLMPLVVVGGRQPALDHAAHAPDRAGGDDPLRGASDTEHEVHTGTGPGGHHGAGDVAVADVVEPRARVADLLREARVPWSVEHDHGDVRGALVLGLGDASDVLAHREADVDDVRRVGSGGELVHVEDGSGVVHRAPLSDG